MMKQKPFKRTDRIATLLHKEISHLIQTGLNNPDYNAMITISRIRVSSDLGYANIYVTIFAEQIAIDATVKYLNLHSNEFRMQLGKILKLKMVPQLHFFYDPSLVEGRRLSALIDAAYSTVKEDTQQPDAAPPHKQNDEQT